MRKGVVLFMAGIGLLCAGIVSTSDAFWGKPNQDASLAIAMGAATTVDVRGVHGAEVKFSDTEPSGLRFRSFAGNGSVDMAGRVAIDRNGSTLRLAIKDGPYYGLTLVLPTRISRVVADGGRFTGNARLRSLRVETRGDVYWNGDAGALTLISMARSKRERNCPNVPACVNDSFWIEGGRIGALTIDSRRGNIHFGNLETVGSITLNVGPEAGLQVDRITDLDRIRIHHREEVAPGR